MAQGEGNADAAAEAVAQATAEEGADANAVADAVAQAISLTTGKVDTLRGGHQLAQALLAAVRSNMKSAVDRVVWC